MGLAWRPFEVPRPPPPVGYRGLALLLISAIKINPGDPPPRSRVGPSVFPEETGAFRVASSAAAEAKGFPPLAGKKKTTTTTTKKKS